METRGPSPSVREPVPFAGRSLYRAVFRAAPDGILLVDAEGRIRELNPRAEELFGYGREELLGRKVEILVPPDVRGGHRKLRATYRENPAPRPMGVGRELRAVRKDGTEFPVEISLSPLEGGGAGTVIAIVRDVSLRDRLRAFGAGALRAAEEERRRLAREIHDDVAQRVAGLLVRLELLRRGREGAREENGAFAELRREIEACSESLRRIARGLRPAALHETGLVTAVRTHLREQTEHADVRVVLEAEAVDGMLDEDGRLVAYRVVQEALSNALRHAASEEIRVSILKETGRVRIEVRDDGRGFDPRVAKSERAGGLGLLGMEERAHLVGGTLEVESRPGAGTRVRMTIPCGEKGGGGDG